MNDTICQMEVHGAAHVTKQSVPISILELEQQEAQESVAQQLGC